MKFSLASVFVGLLVVVSVSAGPCSRGPPWCRNGWNSLSGKCEEPIVDQGPSYKPGPAKERDAEKKASAPRFRTRRALIV